MVQMVSAVTARNRKYFHVRFQAGGVTRERLAGYDRAIRDEPSFSAAQAPGLRRDLAEYLTTLQVRRPLLRVVLTGNRHDCVYAVCRFCQFPNLLEILQFLICVQSVFLQLLQHHPAVSCSCHISCC
jgi:hypothetical protein